MCVVLYCTCLCDVYVVSSCVYTCVYTCNIQVCAGRRVCHVLQWVRMCVYVHVRVGVWITVTPANRYENTTTQTQQGYKSRHNLL
jgi:hypothetical protein